MIYSRKTLATLCTMVPVEGVGLGESVGVQEKSIKDARKRINLTVVYTISNGKNNGNVTE